MSPGASGGPSSSWSLWPGIGKLAYDAINSEDISLLMGTVLIATLFIVLANLAVDILQAFIDPRVRLL